MIDAAHDLFLGEGYGATSINEIARAADVSPQMIYASFGSKAGILAKLTDVVVAGDDAALHGDDGPLLRERLTDRDLFADDLRVRFGAVGRHAAVSHGRAGPVLQLIDSVAGFRRRGRRAAGRAARRAPGGHRHVRGRPSVGPDPARPRPGDGDRSDVLRARLAQLHRPRPRAGWTPEQYAERITDTMTHLLLPDEPA